MLHLTSRILITFYLALPIILLVHAIWRARAGNRSGILSVVLAMVWGLALGIGLTLIYTRAAEGRLSFQQAAITGYFVGSLLLMLRLFRTALDYPAMCLLRRADKTRWHRPTLFLSAVVRTLALFLIGLPFVMAVLMTYRPKVLPADDPSTQMRREFERVEFAAIDGTRIVGWWIPAPADADATRSRRTVLLCHGLGASKSNQLYMARHVLRAGWNVLAIDLRAHGESGGQLTTYGDLERLDVLGAVRWLREKQPDKSERIFGLGASMGAAALLAAAGDAELGAQIDAIAVYGTYDELRGLVHTVVRRTFPPPLNWLLDRAGLWIASVHTGTNLTNFAPARSIARLWPRPVLVIHGVGDEIIDFSHGQRLFDAALQPKQNLWIDRAGHNTVLDDEDAGREVVRFFDQARSVI